MDYEEKEQVEALKAWWQDNGRFVLSGLILGAVILFGWRSWDSYRTTQAEQASAIYTQLVAAVRSDDREMAEDLGARLENEYKSTPYADQARLALALLYVNAREFDAAATHLEDVLKTSGDRELVHVARLRLARLRLEQNRAEDALAVLDVENTGAFAPRYHAVRGDAQLQLGELEAARDEYELALATDTPGIVDRNLLQMKLDHVAAAMSSQEVTTAESAAQ